MHGTRTHLVRPPRNPPTTAHLQTLNQADMQIPDKGKPWRKTCEVFTSRGRESRTLSGYKYQICQILKSLCGERRIDMSKSQLSRGWGWKGGARGRWEGGHKQKIRISLLHKTYYTFPNNNKIFWLLCTVMYHDDFIWIVRLCST